MTASLAALDLGRRLASSTAARWRTRSPSRTCCSRQPKSSGWHPPAAGTWATRRGTCGRRSRGDAAHRRARRRRRDREALESRGRHRPRTLDELHIGLIDAAGGVSPQARLRRHARAGARGSRGSAAAASPSSAIGRPRSTTTSASRSTACSSAGRCRRARPSTPARDAWRCAPRTTRSSTCLRGRHPAKRVRRRRRHRLGPGHLGAGGRDPDPGKARRAGRDQVRPPRRAAGRPLHHRAHRPRRRPRALAAAQEGGRGRDRRLGCRGPPDERQDRPHERRGARRASRRRCDADPPEAPGEIDLPARGERADARLHPADARDPGHGPVQRSRLAVRGEAGRLPGRGRRARRRVRTVDAQRQDAATYFPELAAAHGWIAAQEAIVDGEVVALDEEGRPRFSLLQDRTGIRTGRMPGSGRDAGRRPRSCTRPSTCSTSTAARSWACRSRSASACSRPRPSPASDGPLRRPCRDRWRPPSSRPHAAGAGGHRRQAAPLAVRAGPAEQGLAQAESPPRAGGRRRRVAARAGARRRPRLIDPGGAQRRPVGARRPGRQRVQRSDPARRSATQLEEIERPESPLDPAPEDPKARAGSSRALVIRVEFAEWTADGLLRQAAYKGVEPGKDAPDVRRERAVSTAKATEQAERAQTSRATAKRGG